MAEVNDWKQFLAWRERLRRWDREERRRASRQVDEIPVGLEVTELALRSQRDRFDLDDWRDLPDQATTKGGSGERG